MSRVGRVWSAHDKIHDIPVHKPQVLCYPSTRLLTHAPAAPAPAALLGLGVPPPPKKTTPNATHLLFITHGRYLLVGATHEIKARAPTG